MQAMLAQRANSGRGCSCSFPSSTAATTSARRFRPRVSTTTTTTTTAASSSAAASSASASSGVDDDDDDATTRDERRPTRTIPVPRPPPPPAPPPMPLASTLTTVDRRVYDQVAASRTRLASSLSAANAQVRGLKKAAEQRDRALARAARVLELAIRELRESAEDAEAAAAAAAHAVSAVDRSKKAKALAARLDAASKKVGGDFRAEIDPFVPRRVPLVYEGIAADVRLVGSFDGWSAEGFRLSAVGARGSEEGEEEGEEDGEEGGEESDRGNLSSSSPSSSFSSSPSSAVAFSDGGTRFEGDAWLLPGRYLVKWVVDGDQYRLAPEWPTEDDGSGSTNNVLVVE